MLLGLLQGIGGAALVVWILGGLICLGVGVERPDYRPPGWPWLIPLWPVFVTGELIELRAERRRQRQILESMKRK